MPERPDRVYVIIEARRRKVHELRLHMGERREPRSPSSGRGTGSSTE